MTVTTYDEVVSNVQFVAPLLGDLKRPWGTSVHLGQREKLRLCWERLTTPNLDAPSDLPTGSTPDIQATINGITKRAGLTRSDLAAVIGKDRRNFSNWFAGSQAPSEETWKAVRALDDVVTQLESTGTGLAKSVFSPTYGHPFRGRIAELVREGRSADALALALRSRVEAFDQDRQGSGVTDTVPSDVYQSVLDRQRAPRASLTAAEPSPDDEVSERFFVAAEQRLARRKALSG
jgi:hypothetical protein